MNTEQLRQKLLAASRGAPGELEEPSGRAHRNGLPADSDPARFARRIRQLAQRRRQSPPDTASWASILSRSLTPCFGIMILAALFTLGTPVPPEPVDTGLKAMLLAGLDPAPDLP